MAFKGIGVNDLKADLINPLNVGWFKTSWNPAYCLEPLPNLNPLTRWCFHLYDLIPNPSDVAQAIANNPNFDHWWMVGGNEPDGGTGEQFASPKQTKQLTVAQITMVLAGDPEAKFCLTMGSQVHAFGGVDAVPYIVKVWEKLEPEYRAVILAFHTHYYAHVAIQTESTEVFNPALVSDFCDVQNAGLMQLGGWKKKQFVWLSEFGQVKTTLTDTSPLTTTYPAAVAEAISTKCGRYALYGFKGIPLYQCVWNGMGLTPYGENFRDA